MAEPKQKGLLQVVLSNRGTICVTSAVFGISLDFCFPGGFHTTIQLSREDFGQLCRLLAEYCEHSPKKNI